MNGTEYWTECIACAAEECDLTLTTEQLQTLAMAVEGGHECYGMAFYSPPPSDRISDIENEWKKKLKEKEREFESYQRNAETAIKRALGQHSDANVGIGDYGEVTRYDGRITRIL